MILPITNDFFQKTGALYGKTLKDAMQKYESAVITSSDIKGMSSFLERVLEMNKGSAYADFYYSLLKEEEKKKFIKQLSEAELSMMDKFDFEMKGLYYPVTAENLNFLVNITSRELLFSTFYFTNKKITIWGNYNLKFPIFCENQDILEMYMALAEEYGLETE